MTSQGTFGLIRAFTTAYKLRTAVMLTCLIVAGFVEGIGVMTLLPVIEVLSGQASQSQSSELAEVIRELFHSLDLELTIASLLVLLAVMMVTKAIFLLVAMLQAGFTVAQVTTDLRRRVIDAVLDAEWRYFVDHPIGAVSNSIATESQRAAQAYYAACLMMAELIQVMVYAFVAFTISPMVTIGALVASPLMFLIFSPLIRHAKQAGAHQTQLQRSILERVTHGLQGIKPIKAMGKTDFVAPVLAEDVNALNGALRKQTFAVQTVKTQQEPVIVIGLAIALYAIISTGNAEFSELLVLAILFYRLIGQLAGMQKRYQTLVTNQSAYWALVDLASEAEQRREQAGGNIEVQLSQQIEFDDVSLSIDQHPVLRNVDLCLPAKGLVAISGASGAGKTTLIDVLVGLTEPSAGEIRVDSASLKEVDLNVWRRQVGYVPQEMTLFHASIQDNLTMGDDVDDERAIWDSLDKAGLSEVVRGLPEGLGTVLGEHGARLSGGQRQRLAIARALIRKPKLLILDEVTTSLDPETERFICNQLSEIAQDILIIAISHQAEIQRVADLMVIMEKGQVVSCEKATGL